MQTAKDDLFLLAAQDESVFAEIVSDNLGLVKSIAKRFLGSGTEYDDLVQIGSIGLIRAVRGFEPERGFAFSTYAVPLIIGEIKRFLRDDGSIKVSRELKQTSARIMRFREEYSRVERGEPDLDEITGALGISREEAVMALGALYPIRSIDEKSEGEKSLAEELFSPCDDYESLFVKDALESLSKEESLLIKLRFFKGLSQSQTAKLLKKSQATVSREEQRILRILRESI